ncbi:putative transposase domain protein [Mycoplasmoides gallisepticum CA06_2006.052-5-2P]|uniref:Putative transposase domain protein n=1 Tax=Mycoplasmoides gallisepticum WI01_2001.043-13-2P TaxID=1159201 RepID=J3VHN4_MYCGL|nr:putative transposase domain protein [Mycoplasmoides gallisepticum VA94_7994-1-7P]AFP77058.1 putative transposase domain protein [Mycoplasmoides gallisepticum NC95_13295-2-2P]AFP77816.1 putative transposase domain protein [Mycoplasmoides gallisepticum NC96_1596-4-2P]AFP78582.1 putative transposase domain protein [Mycoplasmoides gallisepticum NY01_2001.047-5-1P]AFP79343.1 putative transposase domain protein [Mycoplasmoides gallisepticum WI01_2001.043-13-2P]AFP80081.1 putative transposase doma
MKGRYKTTIQSWWLTVGFKIRTEESGRSKYVNKTLYVVVWINADCQKELIALYVSNTESATEWIFLIIWKNAACLKHVLLFQMV